MKVNKGKPYTLHLTISSTGATKEDFKNFTKTTHDNKKRSRIMARIFVLKCILFSANSQK